MIVCCGEALIDMIPKDGGFFPHVGGAVLNTAVALGRLGAPVSLITGLSDDGFGQMIEDSMRQSHVGCDLAVRSNRPTTLAMVHMTDGQASYSFYDAQTATRDITKADMPEIPAETQAVFCGGISLCSPPVGDTFADFAAGQPSDRLVMVDPNIRTGLIENPTEYRDRLNRIFRRADIVKVSDVDLDWIVEGDQPQMDKCAALQSLGPKIVLLTKGGDGAVARTDTGMTVARPSMKADVVDTIGAGDTFNAGFFFALHRLGHLSPTGLQNLTDADLAELLDFASRVAAVTVSRAGANPPWLSDLGDEAPVGGQG